jgi:hypothetical protein
MHSQVARRRPRGRVPAAAAIALVVVLAVGVSTAGATTFAVAPSSGTSAIAAPLFLSERQLPRVLDKYLRMQVLCPSACGVKVWLSVHQRTARKYGLAVSGGRPVVVGRKSATLGAGKRALHIRLTRQARRAFAKARTLRIRMTLKAAELKAAAPARPSPPPLGGCVAVPPLDLGVVAVKAGVCTEPLITPDVGVRVEPGSGVDAVVVPVFKGLTGGSGEASVTTSQIGKVAPLETSVTGTGAIEADLGGAGLEV